MSSNRNTIAQQAPAAIPLIETLEHRLMLSADPLDVQLVGQFSGEATAVAMYGSYVVLCRGTALDVVDISNPASPSGVGSVRLPATGQGLYISGSVAYVADGTAGLQIIDVSNPVTPVLLGGYDTSGSANGVYVSGDMAYVADDTAGLQIIDVANPGVPVVRGTFDTSGIARGVYISGNLAYVADDTSGLQIIEVTNPGAPVLRGTYDASGTAWGVCVSGTLAYVADDTSGLQIIDVTNPGAPVRLGGYDTSGKAYGVYVSGNQAYVADGSPGLQIIDVSDPATPVRLGGYYAYYTARGFALSAYVSGNVAYVAYGNCGLQIVDISAPAQNHQLGWYDTIDHAQDVYISGNRAYVADDDDGLQIIDVTNPAAPVRLGGYNTAGAAQAVYVSGNMAYVADYGSGLQVIDVSDSAAPVILGAYNTSGDAYGVYVSGNMAYVADGSSGLQIIDVTNPAAPVRLGGYDTSGYAEGVYVSGDLAYLADAGAGLQIIDVSNPAAPVRLGGYDTSDSTVDVCVVGNLAYVEDLGGGLQILDVSNPAAPIRLGGYYDPYAESAFGLYVSGNLAYVARTSTGIQIIDVSGPAAPVRTGGYDAGGSAVSVYVSGGVAYVADMTGGLVVLATSVPSDLSLSCDTVAESQPSGTVVGQWIPSESDGSGGAFTYSLVSGTDGDDNASFAIVGGELRTAASFNYEVKNSYSVRVRATDQGGLRIEKAFTISVSDVDEQPSDISLSKTSIAENQPAGTTVGALTTTDPDAGDTFTYSLVSGSGSTDNASFTISGGTLKTAASFDRETKSSYAIRVRSTDQGGLWTEKQFTITVTNVNEAPTNIQLSTGSIAENRPTNAVVGTLSAADQDAGDTFTYSLVAGSGAADNSLFRISGSSFKTNAVFDFETRSSYSVRVRATDAGGLSTEKVLTIGVSDVNEAPTGMTLSNNVIAENRPAATTVGTFTSTDIDAGNTFTYSLVAGTGSTNNASFSIAGSTLKTAASFDYETKSSYAIRVRSTDQGGLYFEKQFTVAISDVNEAPTLTAVGTVTGATMDTSMVITYATIAGLADEADLDSSPVNFRIESVLRGTLTKNGAPVTAGTTTLASGESLAWLPPAGVIGTLDAFTVKAWDGQLASASGVTVQVQVADDDSDDVITQANVATIGGAIGGHAIDTARDVDLFAVTVTAGQRVCFDIDRPSGTLDSFIRLFNAAGTQLAGSNNAPAPGEVAGTDSYLEYTFATAGTYYLGVSGSGNSAYSIVSGKGDAAAGTTGAYTLVVTLDADPDDTIPMASPVAIGGTVTGKAIDSATDVDLYSVTVTAGQRLCFDIDRPSGTLDSFIRLFSGSGTWIAGSNNAPAPGEPAGTDSYLEYTFASAGTYYLGVSGAVNNTYSIVSGAGDTAAGSSGAYTLTVTLNADTDAIIATAVAATVNSTKSSSISTADDVDVFAFTVTAGQRVSFDIDRPSGTLDSYIRLFNSAGAQLAGSNNAPAPGETAGTDSYLAYTFATAGTYYMGVSAASNNAYSIVSGNGHSSGLSTGLYTLTLALVA